MKKITLYTLAIAALPLVSAPAFAAFDGFYIGASLGGTETSVSQDQTAAAAYDVSTINFDSAMFILGPNSLKTDYSAKGALFVGYGKPIGNRFYLGAEIFADLGNYKNKQEIGEAAILDGGDVEYAYLLSSNTKVRSFQFGGDVRPGIFVNWNDSDPSTLLYGRVGVAFNRSTLNTGLDFLLDNQVTDDQTILPLALENTKTRGSLRLGAGIEQEICPRLTMRMDYIYTNYGRLSVAGEGEVTNPVPNDSIATATDTSVRLTNNTVMLGLVYYPK